MKTFNYFRKICAVICFFYLQTAICFAQDQRVADSLTKIYQNDSQEGLEKLELLRNLSFNESDLNLSIRYAEELIGLATLQENKVYLFRGHYLKGNANRSLGNYYSALVDYIKGAEVANDIEDIPKVGIAYMAIADVYSDDGQYDKAQEYYNDAIQLLEKTDYPDLFGTALLNAGSNHFNIGKYDLALEYFEKSQLIFNKIDDLDSKDNYTAYILGNVGMIYAEQGKDELAMANFNEAIPTLEKNKHHEAICIYLRYISDIYLKQDNWNDAVKYARESMALAQRFRLKKHIGEANLQLSKVYDHNGDEKQYQKYYDNYEVYRDSVSNRESSLKMNYLLSNYEESQREVANLKRDSKMKNQRIILFVSILSFVIIFLLALAMFRRYKFVKKTNRIIEQEKNKSDNLLLNILPKETAQELKQSGKVMAQKFESVTVLFTDFKGFTNYAEHLSPEKLVESVDYYFSKFDEIMEKYNLEKIKTVGDSYMCAGGLHFHQNDHALKMVEAACEMSAFVKNCKNMKSSNIACFDMRIGISTGPVVAGVVGTRKFAYDIWGDTVNIASRMESNSEQGKVNVSETTYELIKDEYLCEYRGKIKVKNKDKMKMYFVIGKKDNKQPYPIKEIESVV